MVVTPIQTCSIPPHRPRITFGEGAVVEVAEYLALTASLAELVSRIRKQESQPHAVACDIWSDSKALARQWGEGVPPAEPGVLEQYRLARSYLMQLGAWRLRWRPPVYSLLCFGKALPGPSAMIIALTMSIIQAASGMGDDNDEDSLDYRYHKVKRESS